MQCTVDEERIGVKRRHGGLRERELDARGKDKRTKATTKQRTEHGL